MYHRAAPSQGISTAWVKGESGSRPLPLWIKPDKKLNVQDVMGYMRDHFEGTEFDMTRDVGAGPYELPYRWRPLTWKVGEQEYLHERAVSTQQTGFSFVTQSRDHLPDPIGGVLWFGVDDTYSTVYFPAYCGITKVPHNFAVGTGSFHEFRWDSAFWVFNFVSNYCYLRYGDMIQDVQVVQRELEGRFFAEQADVERAALALYKQSPRLAVDYLTEYSDESAAEVVRRWKKLGEFLVYKYLDGNVKDALGNVTHPGYPASWYEKVVAAEGQEFQLKQVDAEAERARQQTEKDKARAQELAQAITTVLKARQIALSAEQQGQLDAATNPAEVERWLIEAATAEDAAQVFQPVEASPEVH
jgi:hypothetical protein